MTTSDELYDEYDYDDEEWDPEDEDWEPEDEETELEDSGAIDSHEPIDRNGCVVNVGDRIRIVGSHTDCTSVYFNRDEMSRYLNDGKTYRVKTITEYHGHKIYKIDGVGNWSWCKNNIEKLKLPPPEEPKPVMFDTTLLDLR